MKKYFLLLFFVFSVKFMGAQTFDFTRIDFNDTIINPVPPIQNYIDGTNDLGDVDADGDLDIVISRNGTSSGIGVFLNDGTGNFSLFQNFNPGHSFNTYVKFVDMDNDGDLDIIEKPDWASSDTYIKIHSNDGTGYFNLAHQYTVRANGYFEVSDINNDTHPDYISTHENGSLFILLNDGQGGLDTIHPLNPSFSTQYRYYFVVYDYNNDNYPDIIINDSNGLKALINNGNNTFSAQNININSTIDFSQNNISFRLDDFDNDQTPEIVLFSNGLYVFKNQGGQYNQVFVSDGIGYSYSFTNIMIDDLDNDGLKDIVAVDNAYQKNVYFNSGNWNFRQVSLNDISITDGNHIQSKISIGDINDDNNKDIIASLHTNTYLFLNRNGTSFIRTGTYRMDATRWGNLATGDVDNDGAQDLLVTGSLNMTPTTRIYKNNGNGYNSAPLVFLNGLTEVEAEFFDADNDGDQDLILSGEVSMDYKLYYYKNDGTGAFSLVSNGGLPNDLVNTGTGRHHFEIADFDHDNDMDILLYNGRLKLYSNDGNGNFSFDSTVDFGPSGMDNTFQVVDLNNDSFPDVYKYTKVFMNDMTGHFTLNQEIPQNQYATHTTEKAYSFFIDLNNDGFKDLVFVDVYDVDSFVYFNNGQGNLIADSSNMSAYNIRHDDLSGLWHYQAVDFDNDGDQDLMVVVNEGYNPYKILYLNIDGTLYQLNDDTFSQPSNGNHSENFLALDYNNDGLYDILQAEPDDELHLYINNGYNTNLNYIPLLSNEIYYCYDNPDVVLDLDSIANEYFHNFTTPGLEYYQSLSDAENQQNALPANYNYTIQGNNTALNLYIRTGTNPPYIITTKIRFKQKIEVHFNSTVVCDVEGDSTEIINLDDYLNVNASGASWNRKFYLSESDAENDVNGFTNTQYSLQIGTNDVWVAVQPDSPHTCRVIKKATFLLKDCHDFQYEVAQIPYQIFRNINISDAFYPFLYDDSYSDVIPDSYTMQKFNFFGDTHHGFVVGSNGVISFDLSKARNFCPWKIGDTLVPSDSLPVNSIFGIYQDLSPNNSNYQVSVYLRGQRPFMRQLINYFNVPVYNDTTHTITMTTQIMLLEAYNIIDVRVDHREPFTGWNHGNGILGIQNQDGTVGYTPPNRNTGPWSADDEAWRFKPITNFPEYQYILCDPNLDGTETFYLDSITNYYNNQQYISVSLHLSMPDAINNVDPQSGYFTNTENAQSIFVRLDDGNSTVIKRSIIAAINCSFDYDFDTVPTSDEDLNADGNYGNDDTDGDGLPDLVDDDDDGDMVLTIDEVSTTRPNSNTSISYTDTDADGIPNYLDNDDDGDGILTIDEDYNHDGNPANDDTNNNGIPDYLDSSVAIGVPHLPISSVNIYPNPSKDFVHIDFNIAVQHAHMLLLTQDGRILQNRYLNTKGDKIKLPITKGLYYIQIQTDKGNLYKSVIKN